MDANELIREFNKMSTEEKAATLDAYSKYISFHEDNDYRIKLPIVIKKKCEMPEFAIEITDGMHAVLIYQYPSLWKALFGYAKLYKECRKRNAVSYPSIKVMS